MRLQENVLPDLPAAVRRLRAATGGAAGACQIVVDGYHAFAAVPQELRAIGGLCFFVGGFLKHAGAGANCCFMTVPPGAKLEPVVTGWLADPSVLGPGPGVVHGSPVRFCRGRALRGGTEGFFGCLVRFNAVMDAWAAEGVTVRRVHAHVMSLHRAFLAALRARGASAGRRRPLLCAAALWRGGEAQPEAVRSHTLVFRCESEQAAQAVVGAMARSGIAVDCRRDFVRVGFGPNHSHADVRALLDATAAPAD